MRKFLKATAILGGLSLSFGASPAMAGCLPMGPAPMMNCGGPVMPPPPVMPAPMPAPCGVAAPQVNCQRPVIVRQSVPAFDPITVQQEQPLGYMKSAWVSGAPNVSITRVYDTGPTVELSDAPSGFSQGCKPQSQYCTQPAGGFRPPMPVPMPQPVMQPAPMPAPVMAAPRITPPLSTSPVRVAPPVSSLSGQTSPIAPDGTYWEKVSGPTTVGGMLATQIICKRQAPQPQVQTRTVMNQLRVVRPVIGVPTPVPTPVPGCAPQPMPMPVPFQPLGSMNVLAGGPSRY